MRSTCGAAQARVRCMRRLAAAPVLAASGFTCAATGFTWAATWRARSRARLAAMLASWFLFLRDIETSARGLPLDTLPVKSRVNHNDIAQIPRVHQAIAGVMAGHRGLGGALAAGRAVPGRW